MGSRAILSNFSEEQCTQNHPQYLSGLARTLFPTTMLEIAVYDGHNWNRQLRGVLLIETQVKLTYERQGPTTNVTGRGVTVL